MASVIVVKCKSRGNYLPLRVGSVILGRDESCDLQVQGDEVSRRHLEIRGEIRGESGGEGARYSAMDAESANGVFVNGRKIQQPTELSDGDTIVIGASELLYTVEDFLDRESALNFFQRGERGRSTVIR